MRIKYSKCSRVKYSRCGMELQTREKQRFKSMLAQ